MGTSDWHHNSRVRIVRPQAGTRGWIASRCLGVASPPPAAPTWCPTNALAVQAHTHTQPYTCHAAPPTPGVTSLIGSLPVSPPSPQNLPTACRHWPGAVCTAWARERCWVVLLILVAVLILVVLILIVLILTPLELMGGPCLNCLPSPSVCMRMHTSETPHKQAHPCTARMAMAPFQRPPVCCLPPAYTPQPVHSPHQACIDYYAYVCACAYTWV